MKPLSVESAAIAQPSPQELTLSGPWTARGIGTIEPQLESRSSSFENAGRCRRHAHRGARHGGRLHTAHRALLRARLSVAHLLEAEVRTPQKWLPQAGRYLQHAGEALDEIDALEAHRSGG